MRCFIGHVLIDNRLGLIVQGDLTRVEWRATLDMIHRHSPGSTRKLTLGAEIGFDAAGFVAEYLCDACLTPDDAQRSRYSATGGASSLCKWPGQ